MNINMKNLMLSDKKLWNDFFNDKIELDNIGQFYMKERPMNAIPTEKNIFSEQCTCADFIGTDKLRQD